MAVTAAHCLGKAVITANEGNCTRIGAQVQSCKRIGKGGDLRIRLRDSGRSCWLVTGLVDITKAKEKDMTFIKYIYVHRDTYLGGGYGTHGGLVLGLWQILVASEMSISRWAAKIANADSEASPSLNQSGV